MAQTPQDKTPAKDTKELSAADAAKAVGIKVSEVLDYRADGAELVVVTKDGRKLTPKN